MVYREFTLYCWHLTLGKAHSRTYIHPSFIYVFLHLFAKLSLQYYLLNATYTVGQPPHISIREDLEEMALQLAWSSRDDEME